jgi:hypothetical protein
LFSPLSVPSRSGIIANREGWKALDMLSGLFVNPGRICPMSWERFEAEKRTSPTRRFVKTVFDRKGLPRRQGFIDLTVGSGRSLSSREGQNTATSPRPLCFFAAQRYSIGLCSQVLLLNGSERMELLGRLATEGTIGGSRHEPAGYCFQGELRFQVAEGHATPRVD